VFAQTAGEPSTTTPSTQPLSGPQAERGGLALETQANSSFARDRNVSVTQRPHEGYEARGLRMGAFLAYPKLSVTAEHNDNIFATQHNKVSDTVFRIMPEVNLNSDWSRHAVNAYARAIVNKFDKYSSEDTTDWALGANARIDALRFSNITAAVDWARLTEPRTAQNGAGNAAKPVRYDLTSIALGGQHELNRLRLSGKYVFDNFNYDDAPRIGGGVVDQDYRDRRNHVLTGRVDYAVSPDTAWFIEVDGNRHDYRHAPVGGLNRDSKGVEVLGGVNFEISALMRGEVAAGYLHQTFKDARLRNINGFGARGQVEWFPTQLTTVTLNGARSIEDSAVPGSGAYLSTNVGAQVDHELMRNVILSGRAGYGNDRYKDVNRTDHRTTAGVSGTYLLNRGVGVTGAYSYDKLKTVRGVGNPYTENRLSVTLTAQF
jgi:hypothetical protein